MNKPKLAATFRNVKTAMAKHSPEILTGIGIAGMIGTTVLAVKATPKALRLIEERREELELEPMAKLSPVETVKVAWKPYIPAAVTGVTSIACLIGASSVSLRRNAALAAAYTLSDSALREYKDKVIDTIGEKKEREIRDKIAEDHIEKEPVSKKEVIITGKGETLCFDKYTSRYFKSDIETIRRIVNDINRTIIYDGYVSLNDFYDAVGLPHCELGDLLGWKTDDGKFDVDFSYGGSDDGTPCLVIDYNIVPKYDYDSFM